MADSRAPNQRRRKESEKSRATRESLVELAAEMFAERGYVQTSIRDISRRADVTSGAIYGHFRNKADLLAAAISVRTSEELEMRSVGVGEAGDYIETLTRLAREYRQRRQLRALILQGAAAAQTDEETRASLRDEQLAHLDTWLQQYQDNRDRMGIHPTVDMQAALLYTWAVELGLGVLEGIGIEPRSAKGWCTGRHRHRAAVGQGVVRGAEPSRSRSPTAGRPRTTAAAAKEVV